MLAFGTGTSDYSNQSIPNTSNPNNFIAPFWDDLNTSTAGEVYVQEFSDRLILQYEAVAPYSGTGSYTYQAVLHSSGLVELFYKEMVGNLASSTIGLENADGRDGLKIAYNEPYIQDGHAVRISQEPAKFVQVSPLTGTTTTGSTSALNLSFNSFDLAPGRYTANIDFAHTGTGTTPWTIPAVLEVTNPPTQIAITSPQDGTVFWSDQSLRINVSASDDDFGIERVEFFYDETKLHEDLSPSYYYNWPNPSIGTYALTARAVDPFGTVTISDPVTITVLEDTDSDRMEDGWERTHFDDLSQEALGDYDGDGATNLLEYDRGTDPTDANDTPVNQPSVIVITEPEAGYTVFQGNYIYLRADVSDPDSELDRVDFYYGETLIGSDTSVNYGSASRSWYNAPHGTHSLTARAVDNYGTVTISDPVTITVLEDTDSDRMEDGWERTHFDDLSQEALGDYDGDGATNLLEYDRGTDPTDANDTPVNQPSVIVITEPEATYTVFQGNNISLQAEVSDPDTELDRVDFYYGETLIGSDTSVYSYAYFTWRNAPHGTHNLTARAVDNYGTVTISDPVTITVLEDADLDRMEDGWEQQYFGSLAEAASADFDGDGIPNVFEYNHGTDPTDALSKLSFAETQSGDHNYFLVDGTLVTETTVKKQTLLAAINSANDYDVIEVRPGTYNEILGTLYERLYVFGAEGARITIIDASGLKKQALYLSSESVFSGLTFQGANPESSSFDGGALYLYVSGDQNKPRFIGCRFIDNTVGDRGGAIYVHSGDPMFISCTIAGNLGGNGSGIYNNSSSNDITLVNTLLWNPGSTPEITGYPASVIFDHSLTRDDATGNVLIDGVNQSTANPGLAFDYSLLSTSVARDAGTLSLYAEPDLDGESLTDGFKDIGADEFTDSDSDGLPDWVETLAGTDLTASGDHDSDYLTNLEDFNAGANPLSNDTDGDGLFDGDELYGDGTHGDTDGYTTGINNSDTDGDGLGDGWEVDYGFNPTVANTPATDTDGDGLTDEKEFSVGGNPLVADTDGDGMPDLFEFNNGLNLAYDDAALDKDDDGLKNLLEYQTGTQANYFDSDGDLLPDGFEYYSSNLDPLVPNGLHDDFDGDGLDTFGEFMHGTNPDDPDTDGDGVNDKEEADAGSDPLDPLSKPFDPDDYVGPPINDANCQPIGDLGIIFVGDSSEYLVTGWIGDGSGSHSERWRLNIGDKSVASEQFGVIDDYELNLNKNNIFDVTLSHIATNGSGGGYPDYDYTATVKPTGFILCDLKSLLGSYGDQGDEDYWSQKTAYLIPVQGSGWSESYSGGDAVGPRYRKVALNGRPMSDQKPEQESETETHSEETYVDAFDLSLRHDTSYVYVPLAASDLVLEANASVRETTWSDRGGLRPHEELTSPFGITWSSNLCAYIEITETLGDDTGDPISVNVVDEGGRSQRFGTENLSTFFPWPSSRVDKKTYLNRLQNEGGALVLYKKYGNKLTYRPCNAWFMYSTDRLEGSDAVRKHTYWRLEEVEDRYGNRIIYDYGTSDASLIPQKIQAVDRPDQWIVVNRSANCRRVNSITDARGNTISFNYTSGSIGGFGYTMLSSVDYPDGTSKSYGYQAVSDSETVDYKTTLHFHANLISITDKRGNTHSFAYQFDRTKQYFSGNGGQAEFAVSISGLPGEVQDYAEQKLAEINEKGDPGDSGSYKLQYGLPRQIASVTLPGGLGSSTFAKTAGTNTKFGPQFSAQSGTIVTDVLGNQTTYTFNGVHGEVVDRDTTFTGSSTSVSTEWMIYYTSMTVSHSSLGTETFTFDLPSGLSLSNMVDFSGNQTSWTFGNTLPGGAVVQLAETSNFMTRWADPTSKTDALGRTESYQYGNYRIMSEINDLHGTVTTYAVDSLGRRKSMIVTDAGGTKLREETYTYDDEDSDPTSDLAGFMVDKRVVAYTNLSGQLWEQDLVTRYVPDSRGRLWKKIVDPDGLALTTEYTYDTNNNRVSVKDPRGNITRYAYDALNRLVKITYPSAGTSTGEREAFVRYLYDARGNLAVEVDEEGHYTLHHHDALSRKVKTVRDMDGLGLPALPPLTDPQIVSLDETTHITAADLVTEFSYNAVNSLESTTDPRGTVTRNFYDPIQRVRHTYTNFQSGDANADGTENGNSVAASSEKTHTEFLYDPARNTGASGFSTEGFKPTQIIRHDAVRGAEATSGLWTLNSYFTYDAAYRPTQTRLEYKPGSFNTTNTSYGTRSNGKETRITTVTDARSKATRTTYDALGRKTLIQDAYGSSASISRQTAYTSTGLAWKSIDPNGNETRTEYDAAGRAVKVYQPDPATGRVHPGNSPITETVYDAASNVLASINPLGKRWDFTYDARNRKTREEAPAVADASRSGSPLVRPVTQIFYDAVGNTIKTIDPRLASTVTDFDRANRPVTVTTAAVPVFGITGDRQLVSTNLYDKGGNVVRATDPGGNRTVNFYDATGQLTLTATNPLTGQPSESRVAPHAEDIRVSYQYDDAGNRTRVSDGEGAVTGFRYDGLGRNTRTIWDEGADLQRVKTLTYDALVLTRRTDEAGQVTDYTYDLLHRLKDVRYVGQSIHDRHYRYDQNSNILSVTHPNESTTLRDTASTWDALNRLTGETSADVSHTYTLDKAGNRLSATYGQTSRQLVSTYDALNRLTTCSEGSRVTTYRYDLAGNIVEKELPNGVTVASTFDLLGRKKTSTHTASAQAQPFIEFHYGYDHVSNLVEIDERYPLGQLPARTVTNGYDRSHRLRTETIASGGNSTCTGYDYDKAGNRSRKTISLNGGAPAVTDYNYGDGSSDSLGNSNQLIRLSDAEDTFFFSYDARGNRISRSRGIEPDTYRYDPENRLIQVDYLNRYAPPDTYHYAYDYRSRRVLRDKQRIVFSGGTSVQEYSAGGESPAAEYIRGSGLGGGIGSLLYSLRDGTPSYKHYNSRGDVVAATDASGSLTYQAAYEAFGKHGDGSGGRTSFPVAMYIDPPMSGDGGRFGLGYINRDDPVERITFDLSYRSSGSGPAEVTICLGFFNGTVLWESTNPEAGQIEVRFDPPIPQAHYYDITTLTGNYDSGVSFSNVRAYAPASPHPYHTEWGSDPDPHRANSKEEDPTGLLNEGFRYRDLETGTFLTRDPLGFVDGPNVYAYVVQNPWTKFDPLGLMTRPPSEEQKRSMDLGTQLKGNLAARNALLNDLAPGSAPSAERQQAAASLGNAVIVGTEIAADITGANTASIVMTGKTMTGEDAGVVDALAMAPLFKPLKIADKVGDANKLTKTANTTETATESAQTTSRAARREAMREAGIPTSQQPVSQTSVTATDGTKAGRQYTYKTPAAGGGTQTQSVQHSLTDDVTDHRPHWEAGNVKAGGQTDSLGRPRLRNDKVKVEEIEVED